MQSRRLGNELTVSALGLGCMGMSEFYGQTSQPDALATIDRALERFDDAGVRQVTDDNRVDAITAPSKLYDSSFTYDSGEDPELPAVSMTAP